MPSTSDTFLDDFDDHAKASRFVEATEPSRTNFGVDQGAPDGDERDPARQSFHYLCKTKSSGTAKLS
jgi:hypothetical protein